MANYFICSLGCPPFRTFRDELYLQMMSTVARANDFKKLTILHLKTCVNAEHNTLKKAAKKQKFSITNGAKRIVFASLHMMVLLY